MLGSSSGCWIQLVCSPLDLKAEVAASAANGSTTAEVGFSAPAVSLESQASDDSQTIALELQQSLESQPPLE